MVVELNCKKGLGHQGHLKSFVMLTSHSILDGKFTDHGVESKIIFSLVHYNLSHNQFQFLSDFNSPQNIKS